MHAFCVSSIEPLVRFTSRATCSGLPQPAGNGTFWGATRFFLKREAAAAEARGAAKEALKALPPAERKRKAAEAREEKEAKKARRADILAKAAAVQLADDRVFDDCDDVRKALAEFFAEGSVPKSDFLNIVRPPGHPTAAPHGSCCRGSCSDNVCAVGAGRGPREPALGVHAQEGRDGWRGQRHLPRGALWLAQRRCSHPHPRAASARAPLPHCVPPPCCHRHAAPQGWRFLERLRVAEGRPKSQKRLRSEAAHPMGRELRDATNDLFVVPIGCWP